MNTRYLVPFAALLGACTAARAPRAVPDYAPAPNSVAALRMLIDSLVEAPEFANAHWGVLIVDPARGDTLYSRNADKLFMPASNMKLVTGSVALAQLGPDYRFRTTFAAGGPVRDSILNGDLLVIGYGDPTVSDRMATDAMLPLLGIADSLVARGIKRITGTIRKAGDAFPDANYGMGWAWDDFRYSYSAGVDELIFNEGFATVTVLAGESAGLPVRASVKPDSTTPPVRITATTVDSSGGAKSDIEVHWDSTGSGFVVTGTIVVGDSVSENVAHRDASGAYLAALTTAIKARGIAFGPLAVASRGAAKPKRASRGSGGDSIVAATEPDTLMDSLFTLISPPLRDILPAFEKPSQNQIGEILLKTLGRERRGSGTADSGAVVVAEQLTAWGIPAEGYAIADGSGLSRHNYLSPRTIIRILDGIRRDTSFAVFYESLPVAGVDGTIRTRMRGTPAEGNVRAKTGYIDKARSLSGYVTTADGSMLYFSMLCNNYTVPTSAVNRVQDRIAARLAALQLTGADALGR